MSLVFAAFTPHPPLLIPTIGQEALKKVKKTQQAMQKLEEDMYLTRPDILIIISPHGGSFDDAFALNVCPRYETDLREFGDLTTKLTFAGEMTLATQISEAAKLHNLSLTMVSEPRLDHGAAVPLSQLTAHLPEIKLLPISFCGLDWKTHLNFGYLIKEQIMISNKRVAVIASGDLSHSLNSDAPAGFNAAGAEFDRKVQELLAANNTAGLLQLDSQLVHDAAECGFRSLLILLGILKNVEYVYQQYNYESPLGVGYLTANFVF